MSKSAITTREMELKLPDLSANRPPDDLFRALPHGLLPLFGKDPCNPADLTRIYLQRFGNL